jgi:hypothetical protein
LSAPRARDPAPHNHRSFTGTTVGLAAWEFPGTIQRPFGQENRNRLLEHYFNDAGAVTADNTWRHIYLLLLWIDPTTGLAHCYESDKCQPGRPWYGRSLAFHTWLADSFGVPADELGTKIDLLFKWAVSDLARAAAISREKYAAEAERQREVYAGQRLPLVGEDSELIQIVIDTLGGHLTGEASPDAWRDLSSKARLYVSQENKRKNLLGEGFEDTLAAILRRQPAVDRRYRVLVRPSLHDLPGFYPPRGEDQAQQVDLALVRRSDQHRTLITCKWSVRSDRERQFLTDFEAYSRLESARKSFDYVLVTNEFDPARLAAACENRPATNLLFSSVVHVNPQGPLVAYDAPITERGKGIGRARTHAESGRLESIQTWLEKLASQ